MSTKPGSLIRDPVLRAVLDDFQPRFVARGRVVWLSETNKSPNYVSREALTTLGLQSSPKCDFPNVVIQETHRRWLVLVDVAPLIGQMNPRRCEILNNLFRGCDGHLVVVNAFKSRCDFDAGIEPPWSTSAWFASEPDHMIHFDGTCIPGGKY